ncbi:DUF2510 domain-containing protein [Cellulomonas fimi]|uniref:DUF2510 domain-containing protein n=1 Tax=Cellulomonas fimi TaxID=1708 RepID=UPI0005A00235|nr:DUF2510 domain-containing protein [Cellulomonas fimi]
MKRRRTPAGWYPDARTPGQRRWFDGRAWTEHTTPTASVPPPPRPGQHVERTRRGVVSAPPTVV